MFIKTCFVNTACVGWTHCTDFPLRCIILLDQTIINYLSGKTFPIQHFFLPSMVKYKAKISDNRLVFYRNFINKRQWKASTTQNTFLINLREGFTEHCSPNTKKKTSKRNCNRGNVSWQPSITDPSAIHGELLSVDHRLKTNQSYGLSWNRAK